MAQIMDDQQRTEALANYNPKDHLIAVGREKSGKAVLYYPAAWRLYELHLRYANANFKSEILYHDEQKGTVIVKAYLYLGKSYEDSEKKAEAMKQGNINTLDKLETAAKARCARDFGVGTEYALDMTPDETDAVHDAPPVAGKGANQQPGHEASTGVVDEKRSTSPATQQPTNGATKTVSSNETDAAQKNKIPSIKELQKRCSTLCGSGQWQAAVQKALKVDIAVKEEDLTPDDLAKVARYLDRVEAAKTSGK